MFNRFNLLLRQKSEELKVRMLRVLTPLKRYQRAGVKAYQAACNFLRSPSDINIFEPLTPILLEPEHSSRYERELWHGLRNPQVRNIALTGEYGAGKSSVIRTFVDRHPEFTYAFVSLATFGKDTSTENSEELQSAEKQDSNSVQSGEQRETPVAESDLILRIEETIVQQLLYAVPADKLPKTRLKRIAQASALKVWGKTLSYIVFIIAALRLYVPTAEKIPSIDPPWLLDWLWSIPGALAVAVSAIGCIYVLHACLKLFSLFSVDGLTLKAGKLETTHHGSVLHKNLDEIIYCFERSSIDVVVIEDLDRFGIHDVFTRLREINFIIKQSPQIKRPVYFIYALRDEMFVVGEKTKFFDLIIPVIPVINSENSREKMDELLSGRVFKGNPLGANLHPILVETVCYYIDDMRLIKNIVNEFDMYSSILATSLSLDTNKLFAIVVIRNLHPSPYAQLVRRKGPIYKVLQDFQGWKDQQEQLYKNKVEELQSFRSEKLSEISNNVAELRSFVWLELLKRAGSSAATHVQVGGSYFTALDFITDDVFGQIFDQDTTIQTTVFESNYGRYYKNSGNISSSELLKSTSYKRRHEAVQRSVGQIDSDIKTIHSSIMQISRLSFRSAAKGAYGEVIRQSLKGLDVVSYLMRAGYFETDYADYFGYFYEGSLSPDDKNLILNIRRGVLPSVSIKVDNPKALLAKLEGEDLEGGRGIITELIDYLSTQPYRQGVPHLEAGKLSIILRSSFDDQIDRMAEATQNLLPRSNVANVIKAIFSLTPRLFRQLLETASILESVDIRQAFLTAILNNLSVDDVKLLAQDEQSNLYPVASALEDVSLLMPGLESNLGAWAWLRSKKGTFGRLNENIELTDLKKLILWGCIELNLAMLFRICAIAEADEIPTQNPESVGVISYRRLVALKIVGLADVILEQPERFAAEILDQENMLDESAESLIELIRSLAGHNDVIEQLFERTQCVLSKLEDIPELLWKKALESDRVSKKAEAVWAFLEMTKSEDELTDKHENLEVLANFINSNISELEDKLWNFEGSKVELQKYLITTQDITLEALKPLLGGVVIEDISILSEALPNGRWPILVYSRFLPYSSEIRNIVATQRPKLEGDYLAYRWNEARNDVELSQLSISTALTLSKSKSLTESERVEIWSSVGEESFLNNPEALEELAHVCAQVNQVGTYFPEAFIPVLRTLMASQGLEPDRRAELLIQCLPSMAWQEVSNLLGELSEVGFRKLGPRSKKIEVPRNDLNLRLVDALKSRGFLNTVTLSSQAIKATSKPSTMK